MAESKARLYEGLFLINQEAIASDFSGCLQHIRQILDRASAEVLVLRKWDERKLAYDIKGQSRGTFLLAYFNALPDKIAGIERDCNLSEIVLRALVLRADHVGETELELAKREKEFTAVEAALRSERGGPAPEEPAAVGNLDNEAEIGGEGGDEEGG